MRLRRVCFTLGAGCTLVAGYGCSYTSQGDLRFAPGEEVAVSKPKSSLAYATVPRDQRRRPGEAGQLLVESGTSGVVLTESPAPPDTPRSLSESQFVRMRIDYGPKAGAQVILPSRWLVYRSATEDTFIGRALIIFVTVIFGGALAISGIEALIEFVRSRENRVNRGAFRASLDRARSHVRQSLAPLPADPDLTLWLSWMSSRNRRHPSARQGSR